VSADATRTHLFMDGTHLTQAGQVIVADYIYSLLVAPSELSFLAETAIQTTFQTIAGIQQQIALAARYRVPGWNVWMNGDISYLKLSNSSNGFPSDPALPISGTAGVDYKWSNGWLVGAAFTLGYINPTFSLGGGYTQDSGSVSLYTGYRNYDLWGDLVGTLGLLRDTTNRPVPIGITVQPNNGSTSGFDLSLAGEIGYDFHVGLMAGKEKWTDPKVTTVFQKWAEFLPYHAKDYAGLTWQNAADTLVQKKSGMYLLGLFVSAQFTATKNPADLEDLDFFPFPNLGTQYDAEKALDAPIDTMQISAKSPKLSAEMDAAKAYLEFWSKGTTQLIMFKNQPGLIPTASDADTSGYSALQKKAVAIVSQAQKITQYFDRDTRSDFAGANGAQSLLQKFLANPTQHLLG